MRDVDEVETLAWWVPSPPPVLLPRRVPGPSGFWRSSPGVPGRLADALAAVLKGGRRRLVRLGDGGKGVGGLL